MEKEKAKKGKADWPNQVKWVTAVGCGEGGRVTAGGYR